MREAFPVGALAKIVNVASIPQRSPFRYPGGKTWFVPYARLWLRAQPAPVDEVIEPFAGGAVVGLTAAFEGLARKVTLVERDPDVAAVWRTILNGRGKRLAERIIDFDLRPESIRAVLAARPRSVEDRAFATIVRNRVQRGGILAPGAGLMKYGENGRGIASRWYPRTLAKRILDIVGLRKRINFIEGDGVSYIEQNAYRPNVVYFVDPPYTVAGRRLYRYSEIDHRHLFSLAKRLTGDFLMTYDNTKEIRALAAEFGFDFQGVAMKNTHHARMTELLIGKDLDWLRFRGVSQLAFPGFAPQKSEDLRAVLP